MSMVKVVSVQRRADGNEWRLLYNKCAVSTLLGMDIGEAMSTSPSSPLAIVTSQHLQEVNGSRSGHGNSAFGLREAEMLQLSL